MANKIYRIVDGQKVLFADRSTVGLDEDGFLSTLDAHGQVEEKIVSNKILYGDGDDSIQDKIKEIFLELGKDPDIDNGGEPDPGDGGSDPDSGLVGRVGSLEGKVDEIEGDISDINDKISKLEELDVCKSATVHTFDGSNWTPALPAGAVPSEIGFTPSAGESYLIMKFETTDETPSWFAMLVEKPTIEVTADTNSLIEVTDNNIKLKIYEMEEGDFDEVDEDDPENNGIYFVYEE